MGTFNDIDANFTIDARGDLSILEDSEAISQSMRNILYTRVGLRPGTGQRKFGTPTDKYYFAPIVQYTAQRLGEEILNALEIYEPRITIESVESIMDLNNRAFEIDIYYRVNSAKSKVEVFRTIITQL